MTGQPTPPFTYPPPEINKALGGAHVNGGVAWLAINTARKFNVVATNVAAGRVGSEYPTHYRPSSINIQQAKNAKDFWTINFLCS